MCKSTRCPSPVRGNSLIPEFSRDMSQGPKSWRGSVKMRYSGDFTIPPILDLSDYIQKKLTVKDEFDVTKTSSKQEFEQIESIKTEFDDNDSIEKEFGKKVFNKREDKKKINSKDCEAPLDLSVGTKSTSAAIVNPRFILAKAKFELSNPVQAQLANQIPAQQANSAHQGNPMPGHKTNPVKAQLTSSLPRVGFPTLQSKIDFMLKSRDEIGSPSQAHQLGSKNPCPPATLSTAKQPFASTPKYALPNGFQVIPKNLGFKASNLETNATKNYAQGQESRALGLGTISNLQGLSLNLPKSVSSGTLNLPTNFQANIIKSGAKLFTMESFEKWQKASQNFEEDLRLSRLSQTPTYRTMTAKIPKPKKTSVKLPSTLMKTDPGLNSSTGIKTEHLDGEFWPTVPVGQSKTELKDMLRKGLNFDLQNLDMQDRLKRLHINERMPPPMCQCVKFGEREYAYGMYYSQLGYGKTLKDIRNLMEKRTGLFGDAIRIEHAVYCPKEGKSSTGCPIAKEIIKRSSLQEKYLVVVKKREGHFCDKVWMVMGMIVWEGISRPLADRAYETLRHKMANFGIPMERHCEMNTSKTCACQGVDASKEGMSYSFGCSWNCYHNMCKFAKSANARLFQLTQKSEEQGLEDQINDLADACGPLLERLAPDAFFNMTAFNSENNECHIGRGPIEKRPFSGTSSVVDFCAHAHHDANNMNNGTTMVVTLLKPENREFGKPKTDRQLHVLPNYRMSDVDEFGNRQGQIEKVRNGAVEILDMFARTYGIRKFKKGRRVGSRAIGGASKKKRRITSEMINFERRQMLAARMNQPTAQHLAARAMMMNQIGQIKSEPEDIPQYDGACDLDDSTADLDNIPQLDGSADPSLPIQPAAAHQFNLSLPPQMNTQPQRFSYPPPSNPNASVPLTSNMNHYKNMGSNNVNRTQYPSQSAFQQAYDSHKNKQTLIRPQTVFSNQAVAQNLRQSYNPGLSPSVPKNMSQPYNPATRFNNANIFQNLNGFKNASTRSTGPNMPNMSLQSGISSFTPLQNQNRHLPNSQSSDTGTPNLTPVQVRDSQNKSNITGTPSLTPLQNQNRYGSYQSSNTGTPNLTPVQVRDSQNKSNITGTPNLTPLQNQNRYLPNGSYRSFNAGTPNLTTTQVGDSQNQSNITGIPNLTPLQIQNRDSYLNQQRLLSQNNFRTPSNPNTPNATTADGEITFKYMDNKEIFGSQMRDIGGLAFELEHGAVLIESAKYENHATTALDNPDRNNPTRIGLVFYQHKNLIYSRHGNDELKVRDVDKMGKYYKMMQTGEFIPTERQLRVMLDSGFKFPSTVLVAPPRKPRDGSGHELPLDIIATTHGCYFINNPAADCN